MIRTSSPQYFSGAEIQRVVSITSAADNPRIGQGIEREKEKEKRNPRSQSEPPRPSFRHDTSIHAAQQPRHPRPKRDDSEDVKEYPPCARILLNVAERGSYQNERQAKGCAFLGPWEHYALLQDVS
jgi:hypothetical protein